LSTDTSHIAENNARAERLFAFVRLLPLYALHCVLLLWAACVFSVASAYQITLNSWRDGRKHLTDDRVVVTLPPPPRGS
jgi:hypothetical protein